MSTQNPGTISSLALQGPPGAQGAPGPASPINSVANPAALTAVPSSTLVTGTPAFVQSLKSTFQLDPSNAATPDNVIIIAAANGGNWVRQPVGTGSTLQVPSGATLTLNQGGTPTTPAVEQMLLVQPLPNPNTTTKAQFGHWLVASPTTDGGLTNDAVYHHGYNHPSGKGYVSSETACTLSIEQHWLVGAVDQMECHIQYWNAGDTFNVRPFTSTFDRNDSHCTVATYFADNASSTHGTGSYTIVESRSSQQLFNLATDTTSFLTLGALTGTGAAGLGSFGALRLSSGSANTGIWSRSSVGSYSIPLIYMDQFDEVSVGNGSTCAAFVVYVGSGGAFDFAPSASTVWSSTSTQFAPAADNTVNFGVGGGTPKRWAQGNFVALGASTIAGSGVALADASSGGSINVAAGGTFTPAATVYQQPYLTLTGSLAANVTVVLPSTVGAKWTVDATGCTLNGHTITLQANSVNWGTTIGVTNLYRVQYGGIGKLYGATLTP